MSCIGGRLLAGDRLYVINVDEEELGDEAFKARMRELVAPAEAVFLDAKLEAELVELPDDEALELLQSVGQDESGLESVPAAAGDVSRGWIPSRRVEGVRRRTPGTALRTEYSSRRYSGRSWRSSISL